MSPFNVVNDLVVCSISTIVKQLERRDSIFVPNGLGDEVARKPAQGEKKTSPQRGNAQQGKVRQRQQPARPAPVTAMSQAFAKLTEKP